MIRRRIYVDYVGTGMTYPFCKRSYILYLPRKILNKIQRIKAEKEENQRLEGRKGTAKR